MDIEDFNRRWLQAWTDKDVATLVQFYAEDTEYFDAEMTSGVRGREALRAYLTELFAATPPMRYDPDETWAIDGGYCGRWICTIETGNDSKNYMRGFDLVLMDGDVIGRNEMYIHQLPADPREA